MIDCKAVIFDLDGTLIDTLYDLGNSVNKALQCLGYPVHEIEDYKYFIGNGTEAMVTKALPEGKRDVKNVEKCLEKFNEIYELEFNIKSRLYTGISTLLDKLARKDIKLSILTNKPHKFTQKYVESHLSGWPFEIVVGQMDGLPRKPDPAGALKIIDELGVDCSQILYLGDTGVDMITAVESGVHPVGVLWGFRDEKELRENGAKSIIKNPLELIELIS